VRRGAAVGAGALAVVTIVTAGCGTFGEGYPTRTPPPTPTPPGDAPPGMVLVPAGEFRMGLSDDQIDELVRLECARYLENDSPPSFSCNEWYSVLAAASPQHQVYLSAFYVDLHEVTNDEYRQCYDAGVCSGPHNSYYFLSRGYGAYPISSISWFQAGVYCEWAGKRLPSEAEWEKAARGTDGRLFPWGDEFDAGRANLCDARCPYLWSDPFVDDGFTAAAPVGSYPAGVGPYGTFDMVGNVWEWVADYYDEDYYSESPADNPAGPAYGGQMAARGGGYVSSPGGYSAASRTSDFQRSAPSHSYRIGVRCAMDAPQGEVAPAMPPRAATPAPGAACDGVVEGWAVLAAQEHYGGLALLEDLEAGFGYLGQLRAVLAAAGWDEDHVRMIQDGVDADSVAEALGWLVESADGDDVTLFYYAGSGRYLDLYLRWPAFFPPLWAEIGGRRILLIDACDGEYFARAVSGDGRGGLAIGSTRGGECNWFGLASDATEFAGPAFTHCLVSALEDAAADLDGDGRISVQEAALLADAQRREYLHETIFPVEEFRMRYSSSWEENPADDPGYPSLWLADPVGQPMLLDLDAYR
jgi:formylglycine-generating enzyme required for sulfatase activity